MFPAASASLTFNVIVPSERSPTFKAIDWVADVIVPVAVLALKVLPLEADAKYVAFVSPPYILADIAEVLEALIYIGRFVHVAVYPEGGVLSKALQACVAATFPL